METMNKRCRLVLVLLCVTAVVTILLNVTVKSTAASKPVLQLPVEVGAYIGQDLPVERRVMDLLETSNIVMRNYVGPNRVNISVAIVYYPQYRVYFHMPEGCMAGRGSLLVTKEKEQIDVPGSDRPSSDATKLVFDQSAGREVALYFFESGPMITSSYTRMRWYLMRNHILRRRTGAALVRFSIRSTDEDTQEELAVLKKFVGQFVPILPEYLP